MIQLQNKLNNITESVAYIEGLRDSIEKNIENNTGIVKSLSREIINIDIAQSLLQQVAKKTQEEITFHISDVVTMALESVFENSYSFHIDFLIKRGKTEAELYFMRDGEKCDPIPESGGGVVDIAAFALRIALWSLQRPRSSSTIVLDEPMKFLSRELQPKAGLMIKLLSQKLGIQFIIVTHDNALINEADKVFRIEQIKGDSFARE